ncbi:MAG TPA: hypothetical protein VGL02_20525, partial [Streptomyces sp.]
MTRPDLAVPVNGRPHVPGPTDFPHGPDGETAAVERLRQHLRDELSSQLSHRVRADESAGRPPMDAPARRRLAEA